MNPSTGCENLLPKVARLPTTAGVSTVSLVFCPVLAMSLCWVNTPANPLPEWLTTLRMATPWTDPIEARTAAKPALVPGSARLTAEPVEPTAATPGFEEDQLAARVRSAVVPSE